MAATVLRTRIENRWNSLKYLDDRSKIDLITMLSQSLKSGKKKKPFSASSLYGIWGDDGMTDAEFLDLIRKERSFNQDIVEL